jgi:HAD superfamily hydrolase (TIGR01509 family)
MRRALQAIVFDFDGVIANSEPLHLQAFQQTLDEVGVTLTPADYYAQYLGFDDQGVFVAIGHDRRLGWHAADIDRLVARKADRLSRILQSGDVLFAGAADFIRTAAAEVPLAIASGALRHEIDEIVEAAGVAPLFQTIVASGDTPESKPSPAPYRLAFERLRAATGGSLEPRRCVAIEDSRWGLESARGAGLRCVGVTNSYPAEALEGAELVVAGLHELSLPALDRLCAS